ncbi:uncharacterized protein O3C94_021190 [Discoglossus pictus]
MAEQERSLDVKPPVVSTVEQEDLNIRDQQQVKEEESPGNIREGPQDGDLYPDLYSEDGEYERDEKSIHQMETHSDPCTDSDKVTPPALSESDQEEETNMRSPREIKEEEIPVNISEGVLVKGFYGLHQISGPIVNKKE